MKNLEIIDHHTGETYNANDYVTVAAELHNWYSDSMSPDLADMLNEVEAGRIDNPLLRAVLGVEIHEA